MASAFHVEHATLGGRYEINQSDDSVQITGEGKSFAWQAKKLHGQGPATTWLLLSPEGGRSYVVDVANKEEAVTVTYRNIPVTFTVRDGRKRTADHGGHGGAAGANQSIASPMPGRLIKLLVKTGDKVKAGQGVAIVEAMKMENELRVTADGTVGKIFASEGTSVEAGQELLVVDAN